MSVAKNRLLKTTYEEGVEAESDNVGGQGEHENVYLGILESHNETVKCALLVGVGIGLSDILFHSHSGD
jgi:hypothetical protein